MEVSFYAHERIDTAREVLLAAMNVGTKVVSTKRIFLCGVMQKLVTARVRLDEFLFDYNTLNSSVSRFLNSNHFKMR